MDMKKSFNRLVPKLFWARPKSEFVEHIATQCWVRVATSIWNFVRLWITVNKWHWWLRKQVKKKTQKLVVAVNA